MFSHPNLTLAVRLKNKVELEKSNSVLEKAPLFCTYDKIFDMKQKRLNGHKLSKVEPPFKAKRTSEKKTETERKIDSLLLSSTHRFENRPTVLISEPAIGVKQQVVNKQRRQ